MRKISKPDVCSDVHFATLQRRVHSQVNGVGGFTAIVLMDEHRVFGDVEACGVPVGKSITLLKNRFLFLNSLSVQSSV